MSIALLASFLLFLCIALYGAWRSARREVDALRAEAEKRDRDIKVLADAMKNLARGNIQVGQAVGSLNARLVELERLMVGRN